MNEENNFEIKAESSGSYITGIFGAIVGGAIATIPWIFVYIRLNYILSLLAMLISFGALKGYEICNGKMSKSVKTIITIISLVLVIVSTLFVLPLLLAWENNKPVQMLYDSPEFMNALYRDLAMSVLFTVLGITASYPYINKKLVDNGVQVVDPEIIKKQEEIREIELNNKLSESAREEIQIVRTTFEQANAINPSNAVSKNEIISQMNHPNAENYFNKFKKRRIILKNGKNYYYNKDNEIHLANYNYKSVIIGIIIAIAFLVVCGFISRTMPSSNNNSSNNPISNNATNLQSFYMQNNQFCFSIPKSWIEKQTEYPNTTQLIDDTVSGGSINIIPTKKTDLDNYSLENYSNTLLKNYMYNTFESFNPEANSNVEKTKIGNYDVYYLKLNATSEDLYLMGYWFETENYFVEIYGVSLKKTYSTNKNIFETVISSFKELQ